jgi:hypothetical protein
VKSIRSRRAGRIGVITYKGSRREGRAGMKTYRGRVVKSIRSRVSYLDRGKEDKTYNIRRIYTYLLYTSLETTLYPDR